MSKKYKDITINLQIPIYEEQKNKDGNITIPMTFDVKGMKDYLERFLAGYIANQTSIKPTDKNESKHDAAIYTLREYAKFVVMDMAKIKTYPIEEK